MNKYTKMMLMNGRKDNDRRYEANNYGDMRYRDYDHSMTNGSYDNMENKFRDRRGREHNDNGKFAPSSYWDGYVGDRYDDRYETTKAEYGRYPHSAYPAPYVPPVYNHDERPKVGFSVDGEVYPSYKSDATYREIDEMAHRHSDHQMGRAKGAKGKKMTHEMAERWAAGMVNTDGTTGAHWTREQVKSLMDQHGIDADPDEFWVVLNAVYSDYCGVAKKHNVNKMEFYIDMAKAWMYDADTYQDKVWRYYDYVVKH